jgi:hypothetical protein
MAVVAALVVAHHAVKLTGLVGNLGAFPTLAASDRAGGRPRTSILVPARGEEARLPHTAEFAASCSTSPRRRRHLDDID